MSVFAISFLIIIASVLAELLYLKLARGKPVPWKEVIFNLDSGHILMWIFRGVEIFLFGVLLQHVNLHVVDQWPPVWQWIFAFIAWDFCFYWMHRLHHKIGVLWAVHVVHHQGEHFNLSLAVRNSWYSSLASIPFFIPMALLGVPLPIFITVSVLHYSIQLMNHSALTPRLGFLEYILVTPAHHRIHHVNDRSYSDSNYAGSFAFFDRLFGTYRPDLPESDFAYGVKDNKSSQNPFVASNEPFRNYLQARRAKKQHKKPDFISSGFVVLSGAVILFALVTGYIWLYGYQISQSLTEQVLLFLLLAAGSVALGGISEGRQWAVVSWFVNTWLMLLSFAIYFHWHNPFWMIGMGLLALHSTAVMLGWGRRAFVRNEDINL